MEPRVLLLLFSAVSLIQFSNTSDSEERSTWRPTIENEAEADEDGSVDPAAYFPVDYYDDYDLEVEGTRLNIHLFHSFEERMRAYRKLVHDRMKSDSNQH